MKQTTKTALKNKPFLTLSGKSTAGWAGLIVFSFVMIFFIGTLVGRGSIKVDLGQKKLSKAISNYEKTLNNVKSENVEVIDDTPDLVFYENLQKKEGRKTFVRKKSPPKVHRKVKKVVKKKTVVRKPSVAVKEKKAPTKNSADKKADILKYTIQIASFQGINDAKKTVNNYKKKGYSAYYVKAVVRNSEVWYRVRIGAFKDRIDAKSTLLRLKKSNIEGFLVTR